MRDVSSVDVVRWRDGRASAARDDVATEAPLDIRIGRATFAVVMRTPGADRELAAGFLLSERVLLASDDLGAIAHCQDAAAPHPENVVTVTLTGASALAQSDALAGRRRVVATSSCGVCGRTSIASLTAEQSPLEAPAAPPPPDVIVSLPGRLRARQTGFERTGGLHAAGLFALDGALIDSAEDVGRHNAVDKVIGRLILRDALPAAGTLLFVSGRTSFEIVQKAWLAGIACVASVSAPSSLAIELAATAGITLMGFVRDGAFNVYTGPGRAD